MSKVTLSSNKVYQTLACLTPADTKRLIKFLESPLFNQSPTLTRLCHLLLEQLGRHREGFDRDAVWAALQPGIAYDDVNFRKYCSDLLKLMEGFMVQANVEQNESRRSLEVLEYVVQHQIEPLYNSVLRQAKQHFEKDPYLTASHYYQAYTVERQYYTMQNFDVKLNVRANLEEISYNLDIFYWIEKLKFYNALLSQRKTGNFEYDIRFIPEIVQYLEKFPVESVPELALNYYSYLTLMEEERVEHYHKFRKLLDMHSAHMPPKEAVEFYDSAMHYCVGRINKGDRNFLVEYFELLDEGMEKGVFFVNDELAPWRFNNAVAAALGLGKIDWAEQFVELYKDKLPLNTRQNTYAFNLARVYRFQGKYKEVLELLRDLEYEDIGYNLLSKRMVIMTYYDLDEFDALESFMESFRVFLNRNKTIPAMRRRSYLNWLKYVRRLTRLLPGDKKAVEQLSAEILDNKTGIANHEWLLEKLEELM